MPGQPERREQEAEPCEAVAHETDVFGVVAGRRRHHDIDRHSLSFQGSLGGRHRVGLARIGLERCAQHTRHRLEAGFGDVMVVGAVMIGHMQRDAGILRQGLEELAHQLGVESADFRRREADVPDQEGPAGNIDRRAGQRLVHGKVDRGVAHDAAPLAQSLAQRLADGDAGVLDRVVVVDMQVALSLDRHVDQRMSRQLVEHMVEETDAGRNVGLALAVDMDRDRNLGFLGLAADFGRTRHHSVLIALIGASGLKTKAFYQHDPPIASFHSGRYSALPDGGLQSFAMCIHMADPTHSYRANRLSRDSAHRS
ncbi:hypothetical protein MPLA_1170034 [Mesorhizobium sp. ORS 3359]|nr:hypothetical protein MPLA_1170034 [Mesorhizobium sp. ORS 3359]